MKNSLVKKITKVLAQTTKDKEKAVAEKDYETASIYRDIERLLVSLIDRETKN